MQFEISESPTPLHPRPPSSNPTPPPPPPPKKKKKKKKKKIFISCAITF